MPNDKLDELAESQNVMPILDARALAGTWPGDKDDGFEEVVDEHRHGQPAIDLTCKTCDRLSLGVCTAGVSVVQDGVTIVDPTFGCSYHQNYRKLVEEYRRMKRAYHLFEVLAPPDVPRETFVELCFSAWEQQSQQPEQSGNP